MTDGVEARREKERLEVELERARRAAHDINDLFCAILNYAQFVADGIGERSPARADVEQIRRAAERGAALTQPLQMSIRREVAPSDESRAERPPARGETVLVVEDEPGVRRLTERILTTGGYDVLVAAGGAAALEVCEREDQPIDLLLTDVVMPEMLGPELVKRAKAARPDLKVLYMSGYIDQVVGGLDSPHVDQFEFIEKPFTADGMLAAVRTALDSG